ncbi:MAG: DUF3710 domain-containing protein [Pseudonocardia sp.]
MTAPRHSGEGADPGDDRRATGPLALRRRPRSVEEPTSGPYDEDDLDPESSDGVDRVDFGALLLPVPASATVAVEPRRKGRLQAVHVSLPEGRLSVSALAAPTTSRLWPELATEINTSLRDGGARVRSFQGQWGRELHARTGAATSVFVGIDGPRWMLYGVATGPERDAVALDAELRRMLTGTVVVRGASPYPVRTVLPLEVPEHLATATDEPEVEAAAPAAAAAPAVYDGRAAPAPAAVNGRATNAPAANERPPNPSAVNPRAANAPTADLRFGGNELPADRTPAARNGRARPGVLDDGPPTEVLPPLLAAVGRAPDLDPHDTAPIELRALASDRRRVPEPEPVTELLPVVRPLPEAPAAPRPGRHARRAPEVPSAQTAPRGHDPALAFLLSDPMALFTAAPQGRHRRSR